MASVAICRDPMQISHEFRVSTDWAVRNFYFHSGTSRTQSSPFQPSPAPSCLQQRVRQASSSEWLQPLQWWAPETGAAESAPSRTQNPRSNRCPCWRSSERAWPYARLRPKWMIWHFSVSLWQPLASCWAVVQAYPLHLGCICGQSRSERTNTVFGLVKPAQILQRRFERSTEGPDQLSLWLPCR